MVNGIRKKTLVLLHNQFFWVLLIISLAFFLRIYNLNFPYFTSDEARVAYRGFTLITSGKDEFGRKLPLLFNSLEDYQLPVVSYLTAGGELVFGKSEFGARVPFIIIGTLLVLLTYQIAKFFSAKKNFWFISAFLVGFSPGLIFLSKVPNETIVLTFEFTLLFYLLINVKNQVFVILTMIILVLTSKQAWFILLPFTATTLFLSRTNLNKRTVILLGASFIIVLFSFAIFFSTPQATRSFLENNFSLFSDITIKNGVDKLRGQGIKSGWPNYTEKLLFNKAYFLIAGFLKWLSHLTPEVYFGKFDINGILNYSAIGVWMKALLIPTLFGLVYLIKNNDRKFKFILLFILILTFPAFFVYPNSSLNLVLLTVPFMAILITYGLINLNKKIATAILTLMVFELLVNIFYISPEYRKTTITRPNWIKQLTIEVFERSNAHKVAISDDIVSDISTYIEWYAPVSPSLGFQTVNSPYKFRQYQLGATKIIGSHESFKSCGRDELVEIFASKRDLNKLKSFTVNTVKTYVDSNNKEIVSLVNGACI